MIGLIVARKGSKGFPGKNRKLVPIMLDEVEKSELDPLWISTDDDELKDEVRGRRVKVHDRPDNLATDTTSVRDVVLEFALTQKIHRSEYIYVLYPTYPQRRSSFINRAIFLAEQAPGHFVSILGFKKPKTHPYLCYEVTKTGKTLKLIGHQLYRRQDYPECVEICHAVCIVKVSELHRVDHQMWSPYTHPFFIHDNDLIDIDTPEDWEEYLDAKRG